MSLSCHSFAPQSVIAPSLGPQDLDVESRWCASAGLSRDCWEMLGAPVATTGLALGRCDGGVEGLQIIAFGLSWGELRAGGPGTFRSEGDYMAARDLSNFHLSDEKLRPRKRKGLGQGSTVCSFQLPPQNPLPELVELSGGA